MSFENKKGITVASGFKLQAEALLDARGQVDTIQERDELVTLHAVTMYGMEPVGTNSPKVLDMFIRMTLGISISLQAERKGRY